MKTSDIITTWNLRRLGTGIHAKSFIEERKQAEKKIKAFVKKYKNKKEHLKSAPKLKKAIAEIELIGQLGTKESYYFFLRDTLESENAELKGAAFKAHNFYIKLFNQLEFFTLDLGKVPSVQQKKFLKSEALKEERHFLQGIFETAQYQKSEDVEQLLSLKGGVSHGNWSAMTEEFLSKETAKVQVKNKKGAYAYKEQTFEQIMTLCSDSDSRTRRSATKELDGVLAKHADVAEKEINSILENKKINDELRGYTRPDQARHISDDISTEVVDALLKAVTSNFKLAKDFYSFKKQLLGVKEITYQERGVLMKGVEKNYTYPQAVKIVHESFQALDDDFAGIFNSFICDGFTDAMPKKGKRGGAFCAGHAKEVDSYILLNFTGKIRDITTIAHEAGHGINNQLIKRKQRAMYCDTPLSTAEVASTFCEDFALTRVGQELSSDEERLMLMLEKLEDDVATIFRQIACYRFEQELHKEFRDKGYLSKQDISKIFTKNMKAYMGPSVTFDSGADYWWVYWSHIRNFFYVYSYSSGLLISKAMQGLVKENPSNMNMIKDVFFSAGTSDSPKNIFKQMGIDITKSSFWQSGINEVSQDLKNAKKLAKKLGKI